MADTPSAPQRDRDVVAYGSWTGLRNDVTAERFDPPDLAVATNVDLDRSGRLARRSGFTKRSAAATHSVWSDEASIALCVQGGVLKRVNADLTLSSLLTGLQDTPMSYAKINDLVYFADGHTTGVLENGAVRSWGLPVPPLPTVTAGLGSLPAGSYQFVTTYVRTDGQESGARGAGVILVGAGTSLIFTLVPPLDPAIMAVNIYISTPNGEVLYHAMQVGALITSATYSAAADLTYPLQTQFLSGPPAGHMVRYYSGRAYVAVDDTIFPSEPYAYELFDLRNYIALDGRVTLMAVMEDKEALDQPGQNSGFFVGTDRSGGVLVGSKPEDFQYVPKVDYGAVEGSLDYMDGSLYADGATGARRIPYWLTTKGLCVGMPGMEIRNVTRNRFVFSAAGRGASVFDPTPNRIVSVSNF